ncbi:protein rep [Actinomycetospora soli]|uniref:protein rep n=1 Tax=Actinomycetospora soli TaxID=2893887 RepID=UPI001E5E48D7|nr:protein rep [Actinomycetospora soli]MCD2191722.1 protein rep [Actinomycetospora soli]
MTVGLAQGRTGPVAGYGGVATCGSVWCCPQCAAVIATRRADELADAIRAVDLLGGSAHLATFTIQHKRRDKLGWTREQRRQAARLLAVIKKRERAAALGDTIDEAQDRADRAARDALLAQRGLWDALGDGWQAANSGGQWDKDKELHGGLLGWVKAVEATIGRSGWHVHVHVLLCFADDVTEQQVRPLVARMFHRWKAALERAGFDASGDMAADGKVPGYDVRRAQLHDNALSNYLTKLAHEVTSSHRKEGRRPGGRTPMQLLADAVETYRADDIHLWWEWEQASAGRKQVTWSLGDRDLRRLADLGHEQTDDEIAAETLDADERLGLAPEVWGWVRAGQHTSTVLDIAETDGMAGLVRWLHDHGQDVIHGAGIGWLDQPAVDHRSDGTPMPLDRDTGTGRGYDFSHPAVLRPRTSDGRPGRRPSDRPPRWTTDARAVLLSNNPAHP